MRIWLLFWLLGFVVSVGANPYCPSSVSVQLGYHSVGTGQNISSAPVGRVFSKSIAELTRAIEAATEAEHPGWDLVLNSPTDGSRSPICFKLYINGKLWPERDSLLNQSRCGAFFGTGGAIPENLLCPLGYKRNHQGRCILSHPGSTLCPQFEKTVGTQACCVGNPISPATGNKIAQELDYRSAGPYALIFSRTYNSQTSYWGRLGPRWQHSFDRSVLTHLSLFGKPPAVSLTRPDGKHFEFIPTGNEWQTDNPAVGELRVLSDETWEFLDRTAQVVEHYDATGKLLTLTYRGDYTQTLSYNQEGNLQRVADSFGRTLILVYDNHHRLNSVQTASGSIRYEYDTANRLSTVIYPDESKRQYLYESSEHPLALTGVINENGVHAARWDYDKMGRAVFSGHALGSDLTSVLYDESQGTRVVADGTGACTYEYVTLRGQAKLMRIGGPGCDSCPQGAHWTYDHAGFITSTTDCSGIRTTYVRDNLGRALQRTEAAGTPNARTLSTSWHPRWNLPLQIQTPLQTQSFVYDEKGLLTHRTETRGRETRIWQYRYNAQGLLVEADGPREDVSDVSRWEHDEQGRLLKIENALGHVIQVTAHDTEGHPISWTDEKGLVHQVTYDARGRPVSQQQGARVTLFQYDGAGHLTAITHPNKAQTQYRYDEAGRLVKIQMPEGTEQRFVYDARRNLTQKQVVGADGNIAFQETWAYQNYLLPKEYRDGLEQSTIWTYDTFNRLVQNQSPLLAATTYGYDGLNRLIQTQDALGGISQFGYDAEDQLVRYTDSTQLVTQVTYDGFNYQEQNPNTGTQNFILDKAGNSIQKTNVLGQSLKFVYDAVNRLTQLTTPDEKITFAYDVGNHAKGHLTSMVYPQGEVRYTYTPEGEIQSQTDQICPEQNCLSFTQQWVYDEIGQVKTITYPSGHVLNYQRNSQGTITGITLQTDKTLSIAENIQHTPLGWKFTTLGNGLVTERKYDLAGNLVSQNTPNLTNHRYVYDAHYNLLEWFQDEQKRTYQYDLLSRLIFENETAYPYDKIGNRLGQTGPTTNAAGQVTEKGNLQLQYDAQGRLKSITRDNQKVADYTYNPMYLRTSKIVEGPNPKITYFVYNPQGQLMAEYGPQRTLIREYFYLNDQPIAFWEHNELYFLHFSPTGTPEIATDQNQQIVWQAHTNAFGVPISHHTPNKMDFPLRFPGQYYDSESGLHYNWHRYYDPELGRYLQPDPIGLAGGTNLYVYANNNPLRWVDPMGLTKLNFDPSSGNLIVDPEIPGRSPYNMPASSGKPNCSCDASSKNEGPIPSGNYTAKSNELTNAPWYKDIARTLAGVARISGGGDWGDWRIPLHPNPGTDTFGRKGFMMHGGFIPGSAGCIDIGGGIFGSELTEQLMNDILGDPDGTVPVSVK